MKQDNRSTQGKNPVKPGGEVSSKAPKANGEGKEQQAKQQAISKNLGRVNDQARDGKERRTSSPHNR